MTQVSTVAGQPRDIVITIGHLGDPDPRGATHLSYPSDPSLFRDPSYPRLHESEET